MTSTGFETTTQFVARLHAACRWWRACSSAQLQSVPTALAAAVPADGPVDGRLAQHLLAVLPRLGEALAALVQPACADLQRLSPALFAASRITELLLEAAKLLDSQARPPAAAAGAADLPAWPRAAAAVLRWLPSDVAAVAAAEQPQWEGSAAELGRVQQVKGLAQHLSSTALLLTLAVSRSSLAFMHLADPSRADCSPAVRAECLAGLWQLHTAACRVVHSVLRGTIPRQLVSAAVPSTLSLCRLVALPFLAASAMHPSKEGGAAAIPPDVRR